MHNIKRKLFYIKVYNKALLYSEKKTINISENIYLLLYTMYIFFLFDRAAGMEPGR